MPDRQVTSPLPGQQRRATIKMTQGNATNGEGEGGGGVGGGPTSNGVLREHDLNGVNAGQGQTLTAYERLTQELSNDQRLLKEVTLGRRIGFYKIRGELGSGNFSQVKMGIHNLTRDKVAIKIMDKTKLDQKTQRLLSREVASMERLHHPNIIRLYEVIETLAKLYIVMEYAGGGELYTKVSTEGRLDEPLARHLYAQLVSAIDHVHQRGVIHRDIKAENVYFTSPNVVKIGDFGFSTFAQSGQLLNTFCGSPPYAAPELFKDEQYEGRFVDVWALGILLFFIATGLMPFRADTVSKLKKLILEGVYVIPPYVTPPCAALIRGLLQPVPADRLTLAHVTKSAWLGGEDFPQPLPKYQLNPTVDSQGSGGLGGLTGDEATARMRLNELGISDSLLRQSASKEARSSIIGTYRIMLHRVQRERDGYVDGLPDEPTSSSNDGTGRKASLTKRRQINQTATTSGKGQPQKPSKLCTLL